MTSIFVGRDDLIPDDHHMNRLANLVKLLESINPDNFNLSHWVGIVSPSTGEVVSHSSFKAFNTMDINPNKELIQFPCGTTACACGHAGLDPWFRKQGLFTTPAMMYKQVVHGNDDPAVYAGWTAIEKFFGLDHRVAETLFSSFEYPKEERNQVSCVIARIKNTFPQLQDI